MSDEQNNASAKPNVVCDKCCNVISAIQNSFREPDEAKRPTLTESPFIGQYLVHEIQTSGLKGCHFCSIISQALCPAHSECAISQTSGSFVTIKLGFYAPSSHRDLSPHRAFLDAWLKDSKGRKLHNSTFSIVSDPSPHPNDPVSASWSVSTSSDATFELARQWLDHCISYHRLCEETRVTPASTNISPFPTYFVDVSPGYLRLCRSIDLPDRPQYLTLSHRWGGSRILKLTTDNLATLLCEIQLSDLPKTFQDAVFITRRLGYRFLWIDSLCIVQDSKEHWETESAIMGDIYRGSSCTIAALGATDADSGCFKSRNPLCFQHCRFELDEGRVVHLVPVRAGGLPFRPDYGQVEPLNERAWAVQERLLSPRTLHYGTYGLDWECVTATASYDVPKMTSSPPSSKHVIHQTCNLTITGDLDPSYQDFWAWWSRVISTYNPCGLTYGTDKLVAIAGIIKLVESRLGLHSIAGLWKEYVFPELLWYIDEPTSRPLDGYQAPTWSWASLNSKVSAGIQDFNYTFNWKIELLDAVAYPAATNGQLLDAFIRLRGWLQLVWWEIVDDCYRLRWGETVPEPGSADDRIYFLPDIVPNAEQELWALLVVHAMAETTWMKMGLLVTRANSDVGEEKWIRVGSFRQYDWPTNPTTFFQDGRAEERELVII
ncbi:heterokaryon incompatibility protein-domain-containing protein [Collybia nuda]|uniref:Heterokaryon incompatibility protein-domain-containing protein n=1 Tax=Collybia nuda TaxID=64659 RepID=A0A9P5YFT6_9AGAR|nr:heterokaryon incompatibility protein-domain-containing protein [Collybia nuda]